MDQVSLERYNSQPAMDLRSAAPPEFVKESRELIQAVKAVNNAELFGANAELNFQRDRDTGRPVIKVLDRETKEVIQQIPPEYVLQLSKGLAEESGARYESL